MIMNLGQRSFHSDQATGWITEESGFDCRQEQEKIFLSSRSAVGSTQPCSNGVPGSVSPGNST